MSAFTKVLHSSAEYSTIKNAIKNSFLPMGIIGLSPVHKAHYISSLAEEFEKKVLIICEDEAHASKLVEDLNQFAKGAFLYPTRDFHFDISETRSKEFEQQRLGVLRRMLDGDFNFVVASVESASQFTISRDELHKRSISLVNGEEYEMKQVVDTLVGAGFVRMENVDGVGQFAVRGDILDVFSAHLKHPIRIEFWDNTIDSIAFFDIETQRRFEPEDKVTITPSTDILFDSNQDLKEKLEDFVKTVSGKGSVKAKKSINEDIDKLEHGVNVSSLDRYLSLAYDKLETIFDYSDDCLVFVCESANTKQRYNSSNTLFLQDLNLMVELGHITRGLDKFTLTWEEILKQYETRKAIFVDNLARGSFDIPVRELVSVSAGILSHWDGTLSYLLEDLEPVLRRGNTCVVMAGTAKSAKELEFSLESEDIKAHYFPVVPAEFPQNMVSVLASSVSTGFEYMSEKFTLFSYGKGLSSASRKVKKNFKVGGGLTSVEEIRKGDYVVHAIHGIGIFEGIVPLKTDNIVKDCIKIAYRGTDVLYVPVTQLDLVAKYVSAGETAKKIKLNKLGTDEWKKTKARVKSSVKEMAKQLTALYAARMNSKGFAFSQDIDMQADFERRFIYDETDDQLQSIREIKHDMEQAHPMDRLLCGDVGFGKTEVALRAAFKCIADGKQCVILVPTTILAFQHYQNIQKRFDGFPVEIEMISRFRTAAQKTKIKQGLKRGSIDLIVGTHSLIAKKVEFKDVGLLIIDEEQRFGVVQKEKLKEKFPDVDVLTLSATPIPRTLNMAMTGIRDMSVLETPPADRKPIQTYVLMHDLEILAEAMNREIRRGGQVYYLHNVVDTIDSTAYKIAELLPDARVAVAHGKMNEAQLSSVWKDLLEGEIDILVCTTIIETGVDVPNANTLIIENAQNLGLAQLHQIRGRIGRSTRRAFAYLTYAENKTVTEIAQKRLTAIREFTQFGAGFQIARKDLELRGGGNVLGSQQHGHLQEVGYDMYLQILSAAVEEEKTHVEVEDKKECLIDIAMTASIPEYYIDSVKNRMYMYKRIARIHTSEDAMDVMDEFTDRFGNPPKNVVGLVTISLLRNHAANLGIYEIRQVDDCLLIFMQEIKPEYIAKMSQHMRGRFMVSAAKSKPYLTVKLNKGDKIATIKEVVKILTLATREKTKQQNKISNS